MYNYLIHHGVKGMKWGVRRYRDYNGRLTKRGKLRYYGKDKKEAELIEKVMSENEKPWGMISGSGIKTRYYGNARRVIEASHNVIDYLLQNNGKLYINNLYTAYGEEITNTILQDTNGYEIGDEGDLGYTLQKAKR